MIWTYITLGAGGGDGGGDGGDDDKKDEEIPIVTLIGIIGGSVAAEGIAIIIAWKKGLFTKGRKQEN